MEAYQARVVDEKAQLDEKLGKLNAFLLSPAVNQLPISEHWLLRMQRNAMDTYADVLAARIASF